MHFCMEALLDWTLVRSFLATAETGSLSAAARLLGLTQPTVGRHIHELEQDLGVVLFARSPQGLQPTATAEQLLDTARTMREAADGFERVATGRAEVLAGTVRITAAQRIALHCLPAILAPLRQKHPEIQIEIDATAAIGNLVRRDADIAIRMIRPDQPELIARRVNMMPIGLYASRAYLDRAGRPEVANLLDFSLIGFDRQDIILKGFQKAGLKATRDHFALRTDDDHVAAAMITAGLGIGVLPKFIAGSEPDLEQVLPEVPIPPIEMWLVTHREVVSGRRLRLVTDHLGAGLAALDLTGTGSVAVRRPGARA